MRKERVTHPGLDLSWPINDERHSCASFKTAVFTAPEVAPWLMIAEERYRLIEIMLDYEKEKVVTLGELAPEWWI